MMDSSPNSGKGPAWTATFKTGPRLGQANDAEADGWQIFEEEYLQDPYKPWREKPDLATVPADDGLNTWCSMVRWIWQMYARKKQDERCIATMDQRQRNATILPPLFDTHSGTNTLLIALLPPTIPSSSQKLNRHRYHPRQLVLSLTSIRPEISRDTCRSMNSYVTNSVVLIRLT